jgi:hypothetical protein
MGGLVARVGEIRNACKILAGNPEGKLLTGLVWLRIGTSAGAL